MLQSVFLPHSVCKTFRCFLFAFAAVQNVHTAGMLAAYYNRLPVLQWLNEFRGLQLWDKGLSGVCIECTPPTPVDDFFPVNPVTRRGGRTPVYTPCCSCHHTLKHGYALYEAALSGNSNDALLMLMDHRNLFSEPWPTDDGPSQRPLWSIFIENLCQNGNLGLAKLVYSRISPPLEPGILKRDVSVVILVDCVECRTVMQAIICSTATDGLDAGSMQEGSTGHCEVAG
jgi:hypothetical protein